jgi:hypothetical protein
MAWVSGVFRLLNHFTKRPRIKVLERTTFCDVSFDDKITGAFSVDVI